MPADPTSAGGDPGGAGDADPDRARLAAGPFHPRPADLPMLALLGGLGVFANQALFITGLKFTTATNASILMTSIPVFAIGAAAVMGVERITLNREE